MRYHFLGPNRIVNIGNLPISLANVRPSREGIVLSLRFESFHAHQVDHRPHQSVFVTLQDNARIQVHGLKDFVTRLPDLDRGGQLAV
jgi:hypothetical protein